jgi:hypothetical protein
MSLQWTIVQYGETCKNETNPKEQKAKRNKSNKIYPL